MYTTPTAIGPGIPVMDGEIAANPTLHNDAISSFMAAPDCQK